MAQKRRNKRGWFTRLVLSVVTVLLAWLLAFLIWLLWPDLEKLVDLAWKKIAPGRTPESSEEEILEEDRRKLDEILQRRQ